MEQWQNYQKSFLFIFLCLTIPPSFSLNDHVCDTNNGKCTGDDQIESNDKRLYEKGMFPSHISCHIKFIVNFY